MSVNRETLLETPASRLAQHIRSPLFHNGYALLFSGVSTSGLGLVYWALAARLYPAAIVGLNSALLSAMLLLSGLAQLSLNNVLIRFLPVAGPRAGRLLVYCYTASTVAAVLLALVFINSLSYVSPALAFLSRDPWWQWAFGLAIVAWGVFSLQDSVLTGLRKTIWVPVENTIFAILKIVLLIVFAGSLATGGIFLSWTFPVVLSLIPINVLIVWWLRQPRLASSTNPPSIPSPFQLLRYAGGNYLGTIFSLVYTNLLPLVVANNAGAAAAAYFYLPWTISTGLQLIAIHLSTSMTVEAALNPCESGSYSRRALNHALRLLLPLVALIFLGAPWVLSIFGKTYSIEGTALLRWLSLAAIPNVVVVVTLGLARVQNKSALIAVTQFAICVLALAVTYELLPVYGIAGAGLAWLISQSAGALLLGLLLLRPNLRASSQPGLTESEPNPTQLERI